MNLRGIFWKIYLILYAPFAVDAFFNIASKESAPYIYYHTLGAFSKNLVFNYYLSAACGFVNLVCLLPIFMLAFNIRSTRPDIWKWLFTLRIALDVTGHAYEISVIRAMLNTDFWYGFQAIIASTVFLAPSYAACFQYAFPNKKIIK
ncbi:MAG TPA: hypothetical protein PL155_09405 [Candidatus Omnitrophota bacterium]|nr:hypothetical protein [Candidatus Omnitrophota bacterium]HPD85608.1 hypothetical protein [Candidatus Omnitrophota bacterium]HRZ04451.1 hypothetical protein [Candidatus Omnitrophota bacterium]